ncbi:MAG: ankyrin repeat domain-containing protein [Acholeplasmatales bacterium]|jgi:ankyrin repeat protein|nr:ankyrin repeat domain-containing protein [Acholeplasmatales bacterium]
MKKKRTIITTLILIVFLGVTVFSFSPEKSVVKMIHYIDKNEINNLDSYSNNNKSIDKLKYSFLVIPEAYNPTVLEYACSNENLDAIKVLLANGANPNNPKGIPPLFATFYYSSRTKSFEIIDILIENGVDLNNKFQNSNVLHFLIEEMLYNRRSSNEIFEYIRTLIEKYNVDYKNCSYWGNLINDSALYGNFELLDYFLNEKNISLNEVNEQGNSALHYAVFGRKVESVKYLLELGIDRYILNNEKMSPYDIAVKYGYQDIIDLLK